MAVANIETILGYSKLLATQPYIGSVLSVLCNPSEQVYDERIEKVLIRSAQAGAAGNYTGLYDHSVGGSDIVKWNEFTLKNDRYKPINVPYEKEIASYSAGMKPSIVAITEDYLNRQLSREIDAVGVATLYSKLNTTNQLTETDLPVTSDKIFDTLDSIRAKAFNKGIGYNEVIFVFVASGVYEGLLKYTRLNAGLANSAVLKNMNRNIKFGDKLDGGNGIEITTQVISYNNMIILPMPEDRMYTSVDLLDGKSVGQTDGGYKKADSAKDVLILAVPQGSSFLGIRFHISNYFVPMIGAPNESFNVGLDSGIHTILGNVMIDNAGVNQIGMNYTVNFRTLYDADHMPLKKDTVFAVTKTA